MMFRLWNLLVLSSVYVYCDTIQASHDGLWSEYPGKCIYAENATTMSSGNVQDIQQCLQKCIHGHFGNFFTIVVSIFWAKSFRSKFFDREFKKHVHKGFRTDLNLELSAPCLSVCSMSYYRTRFHM